MIAHRRFPIGGMAAALAFALAGCDAPTGPEAVDHVLLSRNADGSVSSPFMARAVTEGLGPVPDPACGAPPRLLTTQVGEGQGTHLGLFSVRITSCTDFTDILDDGQLTGGESIPYDNVFATLTAANGDELYFEGAGVILASDHPDFDFEFHDTFSITGGTGRFSGASGEVTVDGFAAQAAPETYQELNGTLDLPWGS